MNLSTSELVTAFINAEALYFGPSIQGQDRGAYLRELNKAERGLCKAFPEGTQLLRGSTLITVFPNHVSLSTPQQV